MNGNRAQPKNANGNEDGSQGVIQDVEFEAPAVRRLTDGEIKDADEPTPEDHPERGDCLFDSVLVYGDTEETSLTRVSERGGRRLGLLLEWYGSLYNRSYEHRSQGTGITTDTGIAELCQLIGGQGSVDQLDDLRQLLEACAFHLKLTETEGGVIPDRDPLEYLVCVGDRGCPG